MNVDFSNIIITDINGNEVEGVEISKLIADYIYKTSSEIDYVDIAMEINRSGDVDLKRSQVEYIRDCFMKSPNNSSTIFIAAFVRNAIVKFLNSLLDE